MSDLWTSIVRTVVPLIVGAVLGWVTSLGISADPAFEAALTTVLTGAFTAVYYVVVRLFEKYVSPKFGWLLGLASDPAYGVGTTNGIPKQ